MDKLAFPQIYLYLRLCEVRRSRVSDVTSQTASVLEIGVGYYPHDALTYSSQRPSTLGSSTVDIRYLPYS